MATANMHQDPPLVEGWWLKKKGNLGKAKHRYLVLTNQYLDWYEKPVRRTKENEAERQTERETLGHLFPRPLSPRPHCPFPFFLIAIYH